MATTIHSITRNQGQALKLAFGYESYPNGNHGHPEKAAEFLRKRGLVESWKRGNPHVCGSVVAVRNWPKAVLRELKQLAEIRIGSAEVKHSWPWFK